MGTPALQPLELVGVAMNSVHKAATTNQSQTSTFVDSLKTVNRSQRTVSLAVAAKDDVTKWILVHIAPRNEIFKDLKQNKLRQGPVVGDLTTIETFGGVQTHAIVF